MASVAGGGYYLLVLRIAGYYDGYFTVYVDQDGAVEKLQMVKEMEPNQDRVVLSWSHEEDLDLWVYTPDRTSYVGWEEGFRTGSVAGGYRDAGRRQLVRNRWVRDDPVCESRVRRG